MSEGIDSPKKVGGFFLRWGLPNTSFASGKLDILGNAVDLEI